MAFTATANVFADDLQKPSPDDTPAFQKEKLNRGFVVINTSASSSFLSWRLLDTDDVHTSFLILKDGEVTGDTIRDVTSKRLASRAETEFQLVTLQNGVPVDTVAPVAFNNRGYHLLQLDRPEGGTIDGEAYTYSPNDCSVGDVDGDGEYELIVKWDPSNSKDNSQSGYTGNVYLDCYRLFTGEKLWRIDLGVNIRAGAHYTQFLVYDFDKDGKAELICKTAPGSRDGEGKYVNQVADIAAIKNADNRKDHRVSGGRVNGGHEYLTVFEGLTGKAIHTIAYYPNRNAEAKLSDAAGSFNWDDRSGKNDKGSYGNRGERYLACVAYLEGNEERPSAVLSRGYYTYAYVWAVDFDGEKLKTRWLHSSDKKTSYRLQDADGKVTTYTPKACSSGLGRNTMYANGNHNLSVGDVDGDGCDEIIWGSAALDNDGKMLYSVGFGHGDAIHLADMNPDRPGLELFDIHEEKGDYAWDLHDAATGEILWKGGQKGADNGRGVAADIASNSRGYEFWSAYGGFDQESRNQNPFNAITGKSVGSRSAAMNFRIYWDGDAYDELLDGTTITKWTTSSSTDLGIYVSSSSQKAFTAMGMSPSSCNSTKATPCLQADLFGDWREEVIWWNSKDPSQVYIVSTTATTKYRVPTLMHDHLYRMGIAWQNCAYNQPPHLGYYLPDYIESFKGVAEEETAIGTVLAMEKEVVLRTYYNLNGQRITFPADAGRFYIVKLHYADGSVATQKCIVK
ncbi:MAG: rhamnogalacturonan lyase [Bacteroidaceae bacterium]|nr:rhamnogalacturonan lyase [Bacteroidaceae bacterium]